MITTDDWIFIGNYVEHWDGYKAVIDAGYVGKYPRQRAYDILKKPEVREEVERIRNKMINKIKSVSSSVVIDDALAVLTADPLDLVEHKDGACRFCHGKDHLYHFTCGEMSADKRRYAKSDDWLVHQIPYDPAGGTGYDRYADPHPDCPECNGHGIPYMVIRDSRTIPPAARKLIAGYKKTKTGVEVIMRSQDAARDALAKYLGLNKDAAGSTTVNVNVNGNLGNLTDEQLEKIARGEQ
jgi:hypothetical protein